VFRSEADWFIGEPDLKVTTPNEFTMYANGPDWWIDQYAEIEITEDRWIKSMEIKPSNPKVVHHVVVYAIEPDAPDGTPEGGVMLHEYAVGKYGDIFGDNTGRLLKKGTRLRYDMHYFAVGSEQHNKTTIAFKFYPKGVTPKYQVRFAKTSATSRTTARGSAKLGGSHRWLLPAAASGADRFVPAAHAHARQRPHGGSDRSGDEQDVHPQLGRSLRLHWHINYVYADDAAPLLPAGTVLHLIGIHDNTSANRRNPDPNMWVGFGERSVDDMLQVWLDMVYLDEADYQRLVEARKARPATSTTAQPQQQR